MATTDPLEEAEVYIAYGRKAQALELLRQAARVYPERKDIHQRLSSLEKADPVGITQFGRLLLGFVIFGVVAVVVVVATNILK